MSNQIQIPLMGAMGATQLQNNGYKNSATAIAEIVDNAIQAEAKDIKITLVTLYEHNKHRIKDILITDDGLGMSEEILSNALQFQGGTNHGATSGLGKYGMGLPASSCNQTKYFEVYSWQTKTSGKKKLLYTYLDLDEIEQNNNPFLNPIEEKVEIEDRILKSCFTDYSKYNSGTLVFWKNVNRVTWKNISTLVDHIEKTLGRKFRYYLFNNKINISIKVMSDNGQSFEEVRSYNKKKIKYFDPMFLMEGTITKENAECREFEGVTSVKYGIGVDKTFIQTDSQSGEDIEHKIRINFSHVKKEVREWFKINGNTPAGKTALGQLYKNRNDINVSYPCVSVLRAEREIDHHNYGFVQMSTGTKYEMERWFSVEVLIDTPVSDWIFEIDNRKQNAKIYQLEEANDFKESVHKDISNIISRNIREMRRIISNQLTNPNPPKPDPDKPTIPVVPVFDPNDPLTPGNDITPELKKELENWIIDYDPSLKNDKVKLKKLMEWCLALPCRHYIIYRPLGDIDLYSFNSLGTDRTIIEINTNHSFYQEYIEPIESNDNKIAKDILRLLFSSLVSAEQTATLNSQEK